MVQCKSLIVLAALATCWGVAPSGRTETIVLSDAIAGKGADITEDVPNGDFRDGVFVISPTFGSGLGIIQTHAGESRAALEFSLANLDRAASIESATLTIEVVRVGPLTLTFPIRVDGYLGDGAISPADFTPDNPLTIFDVVEDFAVVSLDVTDFVRDISGLAHLPRIVGFGFRPLEVRPGGQAVTILEREPNGPRLEIVFTAPVPEPATWLLAAVGGMLLAAGARRRA